MGMITCTMLHITIVGKMADESDFPPETRGRGSRQVSTKWNATACFNKRNSWCGKVQLFCVVRDTLWIVIHKMEMIV